MAAPSMLYFLYLRILQLKQQELKANQKELQNTTHGPIHLQNIQNVTKWAVLVLLLFFSSELCTCCHLRCYHHFAHFLQVPGRETSRTSLKWTNHQQPVSTTIAPERLDLNVQSHSGKKNKNNNNKKTSKNQIKVAGSFFSSTVNHSASGSKVKSQIKICVGGKQTKDFGSETLQVSLHVKGTF